MVSVVISALTYEGRGGFEIKDFNECDQKWWFFIVQLASFMQQRRGEGRKSPPPFFVKILFIQVAQTPFQSRPFVINGGKPCGVTVCVLDDQFA